MIDDHMYSISTSSAASNRNNSISGRIDRGALWSREIKACMKFSRLIDGVDPITIPGSNSGKIFIAQWLDRRRMSEQVFLCLYQTVKFIIGSGLSLDPVVQCV